MTNKDHIYQIVRSIPAGKVATYGQIAKLTGINSPRVVGNILHNNPDPVGTPCYKVVNHQGRVAENFGSGKQTQIDKLKADGVTFVKPDYVDLAKHLWRPNPAQ